MPQNAEYFKKPHFIRTFTRMKGNLSCLPNQQREFRDYTRITGWIQRLRTVYQITFSFGVSSCLQPWGQYGPRSSKLPAARTSLSGNISYKWVSLAGNFYHTSGALRSIPLEDEWRRLEESFCFPSFVYLALSVSILQFHTL